MFFLSISRATIAKPYLLWHWPLPIPKIHNKGRGADKKARALDTIEKRTKTSNFPLDQVKRDSPVPTKSNKQPQ